MVERGDWQSNPLLISLACLSQVRGSRKLTRPCVHILAARLMDVSKHLPIKSDHKCFRRRKQRGGHVSAAVSG